MAKSYLFDGRSLGVLLVSGSLAGLLLFFAGVLVGYHWSGAKIAAAAADTGAGAGVPQMQGSVPARTEGAATAQPQVLGRRRIPSTLPRGATPQSLLAQGKSELGALRPKARELGRESARDAIRDAGRSTAEEPADEGAEEEQLATVAEPAPAQERPEFALPPLPAPPPSFSLQVGAFLEQENLDRFVADLTERGYTPRVQKITSSTGRVLSVVRVGGFEDRSAAVQAALTFQQREGMDAFVRPEERS